MPCLAADVLLLLERVLAQFTEAGVQFGQSHTTACDICYNVLLLGLKRLQLLLLLEEELVFLLELGVSILYTNEHAAINQGNF